MSSFLIVDEDRALCDEVAHYFQKNGYKTEEAFDYPTAKDIINNYLFDVILSDTHINGGTVKDLLNFRKNLNAMMIVSAEGERILEAIQAVNDGAFDFIKKPFSIPELNIKVEKAIGIKRLKHEVDTLRGERNLIYNARNFIGESLEIKKVFKMVDKAAHNSFPVLVRGEVGTGKELVAGAIHYSSERKKGGFIKVNCAALSEEQLETELFGCEGGASEEDQKPRVGRFEQADGGTIFIAGLDSMSLITQRKVLKFMQGKTFTRLGSDSTIFSDVRFIFATSKNMISQIERGHFCKDFYHWIQGNTIDLPPLRKRRDDIILLTFFFLKKACGEMKMNLKEIQPMAIKLLTDYSWPGNIRELENTIEHAILHSAGDTIKPEDLRLPCKFQPVKWEQKLVTLLPNGIRLEEVEKDLLLQGLKMCDWIKKDAAEILGVSEQVLNYKINRFGITHPRWK
jgi:DNA-binding NtrC family response regulator